MGISSKKQQSPLLEIDFEKVNNLQKEYKELEETIISINKYAKLLACGQSISVMNFTITNTAPKKTRRSKVIDSDGDLISQTGYETKHIYTSFGIQIVQVPVQEEENTSSVFAPQLTPETMLRVFAVILADKQKRQEEIKQQIEKQGLKLIL